MSLIILSPIVHSGGVFNNKMIRRNAFINCVTTAKPLKNGCDWKAKTQSIGRHVSLSVHQLSIRASPATCKRSLQVHPYSQTLSGGAR